VREEPPLDLCCAWPLERPDEYPPPDLAAGGALLTLLPPLEGALYDRTVPLRCAGELDCLGTLYVLVPPVAGVPAALEPMLLRLRLVLEPGAGVLDCRWMLYVLVLPVAGVLAALEPMLGLDAGVLDCLDGSTRGRAWEPDAEGSFRSGATRL
jgi:hypothetical protein